MQDHDFDKLFARKMDGLPGKPPTGAEWSDISSLLDARDRRRSRWLLSALLLLFGLLAAGNVFWWQAWKNSASKSPPDTSGHGAVSGGAKIVLTDTLVRRTVVIQYDTVYRTVEIRRVVKEVFQNSGGGGARNPVFSKNGISENPGVLAEPFFAQNSESENLSQKREGQAVISKNDSLQILEIQTLKSKNAELLSQNSKLETQNPKPKTPDTIVHILHADDSLFQNLLAQRNLEKTRRSPRFHLASPDLGITAGICLPQVPGQISGFGWQTGLAGSVEVADGWRVAAAVSRQKTTVKSNDTDILPAGSVPQPGGDFRLKYWESYQVNSWEWSAGLRYEWRNQLIFKPFVGLDLRQWRVGSFDAEFEFADDQNSIELYVPVEIQRKKPNLGWSATVGGTVWLSRRWGWGQAVVWRNGGQRGALPGWGWGLESRLFHRFGK